ncbi:MAG: glycosyltransferase family 4 protein [Bacteroidota bacterium]
MKVLHLFPYLPTPPTFGGALRVYHILKHLVRHHDVTVAGFQEYGDRDAFEQSFPELKGKSHLIYRRRVKFRRMMQLYSYLTPNSYWYNWAQSPQLHKTVQELLDKEDFDFVIGEFASMGHFDLETDAIRILDAHNVEYDNFRRMSKLNWSAFRKRFYEREYTKSYREEVAAFQRHDAIFATSQRDADLIGKDVPDIPRFVIPNGVDTQYFSKNGTVEEPYSIVFTGTMRYVPNYDGMIYFLNEIFPEIKRQVPQAKIYIVGNNPPPVLQKYASDSVIITGFVDDVRPYIDRASVYVVPLNMGSGTRLKVVEALSMRKPVVSTSIGCEGIDVVDGEHIIIRDDSQEFAEAVIQLFTDHSSREKLIEQGYDLVTRTYDWRVIGRAIDEAFQTLHPQPQMAADYDK